MRQFSSMELYGAAIYPALPLEWSETCTLVLLLPSVSTAPGNQSLPIPDWFLYCTDEEGSRSHTVHGWPRHHHGSRDGGSRTGVLAAFLQTTIITTNRRHTSGRHGLRLTDTTRFPCRHGPPKPERPRFANSWGRGNMPVPKRRVLFVCQQVRHSQRQDQTTTRKSSKTQRRPSQKPILWMVAVSTPSLAPPHYNQTNCGICSSVSSSLYLQGPTTTPD